MPSRVVMLVDFDYFFAQSEELRNPSIKDKPVVVCVYSGRTEDSGAVSTANYVARKYGVKSGIPIYLAKKKLEGVDSVFLPVDYDFYEEVSARVMNILRGFSDAFEQVGIDEGFLDVSSRTKGDFSFAEEFAGTIKNEVFKRERLTCSLGVGPNKLVAKIAADERKPNGLTVVRPDTVQSFLDPLPVNRLIGVGTKTLAKMQGMGVNSIGDLAKVDVQRLISVFGRSLGAYFCDASHGLDDEPVEENAEVASFSRIATLKQNTRDLDSLVEKANELCDDLASRILNEGFTFKTVGVMAVMTDLRNYSRSKSLDSPSNSVDAMKKIVKELFAKFLDESELDIRRVGVKVSSLARVEKNQAKITRFFESA